jgi:hypothetical protein
MGAALHDLITAERAALAAGVLACIALVAVLTRIIRRDLRRIRRPAPPPPARYVASVQVMVREIER